MSELTLEQQFMVQSLAVLAKGMTEAQVKEVLLRLYEDMMLRENMVNGLLKTQWGIY